MKNTILIVLVLLFYACGNFVEKKTPFNKIELSNNNTIYNNSSIKYLDTIVHVGLDTLGVKGLNLVINNLSPEQINKYSSGDAYKAILSVNDSVYYIWVDSTLSRRMSVNVLSHEMIHIKQYYNNELTIKNGSPAWKGEPIQLESVYYFDQPWEVEAFDLDGWLYLKIIKTLY